MTAGEGLRAAIAEWAEAGSARYRSLFAAIDEGFCVIEVLHDRDGRPVDYRFLEVNPAFVRHTGLHDAVGRTMRDLVPDHDAHWFETYGRVARTREPIRFEQDAVALGRVFDVYAFAVGRPEEHQVAVLFTDISERRRRERNLVFLAAVADETDRLVTPEDITRAAGARLGAFLGITRCDVVEIDEAADEARLTTAWAAEGAVPAPERFKVSDFVGAWFARAARGGEPVVVHDVGTDPRTRRRAASFGAAGSRAWIAVPVVLARASPDLRVLVVSAAEPRAWHREDVEVVVELAGRLVPRLERAQAQEAVRDRDLRLRLALEASGAGTFVWHPDEDRAEPDARMRELLGLAPGAQASLADTLLHPDGRAATEAALARALDPSGGGLYIDEVHIVTPAGEDRWLSVAARVTFAGDPPRPTQMFGMATDVTTRRRAEESLRASGARQAFLLRLNDALRPLSRPTAIRQAAARLLQEHLGAGRTVLLEAPMATGSGLSSLAGAATALCAGGPAAIEDVDGSPLLGARERALARTLGVGAVLAAPVGPAGEPGGLLLVADEAPRAWRRDEVEIVQEVADRAWAAMERARSAAAVGESERRLQRALAIETVGVVFFDRSGTLTHANAAFLRASGYTREDLERGALTRETITPADARDATRAATAELRSRGRMEPQEREYVRRDGTRWPALAAATMLSRPRASSSSSTSPRSAPRRRRPAPSGPSASGASGSSSRTPPTRCGRRSPRSSARCRRSRPAPWRSRRSATASSTTSGARAARLARLSESLLVLAGLDGTRMLARAPVPLLEVLEDVAADLTVAPGVEVTVDADPDLEVVTNQGLVERVVANFAQNAAKHTTAGRIDLTARRDGDTAIVEVRDTGSGLGEGAAERAFDRFYRGGDRSSDGFGLGLAIARQAAAAVDGTIDLGPAPDGGTVARLVLPAR